MQAKEPAPHDSALVSKGHTDVFPGLDALMGNYESEVNIGTPEFTK